MATEDIQCGGTILCERSLIAMQSYESESKVSLCHTCSSWAGTMAEQLSHLACKDFHGEIPSAEDVGMQLDGWVESPRIRCESCGETYCSESCMSKDHEGYWGWLCRGGGNLSWKMFMYECREAGSEHFELSARCMDPNRNPNPNPNPSWNPNPNP